MAVEAQAMNKPIVASDIGGSKETVLNGKSGLLYKYNDPKELAKAINKIMKMDKQSLKFNGRTWKKKRRKKI